MFKQPFCRSNTLVQRSLILTACLVRVAVGAEYPAAGKFLVATEGVHGEIFNQTVILLMHYDEDGALGLVVNRPTEFAPGELMADVEALSNYSGTFYWGGPVEMSGVRALLRSQTPPDDAVTIVGNVHLVPVDQTLENHPTDPASIRFYFGYAGWAQGQLERELAAGSWDIVAATGDMVFAADPDTVWKRLAPVREYRAAAGAESSVKPLHVSAAVGPRQPAEAAVKTAN
jgi:putative transcriptional regulator